MATMPSLVRAPHPGVALLAIVGTAITAAAWRWLEFARCARIGEELANRAIAFECHAGDDAPRVLVVGDSTGVGTGAARPEDSIAGRLSAQFPGVTIVNRARNGARTLDALIQLADEGPGRYDLVLVHVGGNDVLRRTPFRALVPQVEAVMIRARRLSEHVVTTTAPNIGLLPAFFPPFSWWLSRRTKQLCELFADTAKRHGVHYVNFFHSRGSDPFRREWQRYFAQDKLHPSTDCYRYVYDALVKATPIPHALAKRHSALPDLGAHVDQLGKEHDVERAAEEAGTG
jgi:lysophospholipase L1-like esterase